MTESTQPPPIDIIPEKNTLESPIKPKKKAWNFRILLSLLTTFTGFFTNLSGIILLFFGEGLKALGIKLLVFTESFLGLRKPEWLVMHILFGLLFTITGLIHFIYNWPRFRSYYSRYRSKLILRMSISSGILITFTVGAISGLILYFIRGVKDIPELYMGILTPLSELSHSTVFLHEFMGFLAGPGEGGGQLSQLSTLHSIISVVFFLLAIVHVIYNWRALYGFLTLKTMKKKIESPEKKPAYLRYYKEILVMSIIVIIFLVSSILYLPPLRYIIDLVRN